jgi:hypothetical protein
MPLSRRDFLGASALGAAGLVLPHRAGASPVSGLLDRAGLAPAEMAMAGRPAVIASANGLRGVRVAYDMMAQHGADPLDAAIEGVKIQELDPDNKQGEFAGAAAYAGSSYAVCDARRARLERSVHLFRADERPTDRPISGTMHAR